MIVLCGGAGSGKSHACGQKAIYRCLAEPGTTHLITRKVGRSIRNSCFTLIEQHLREYGLYSGCKVNKQDMEIRFPEPVNSRIIFTGLDDVEKLKSITGVSSIWCEEASEMDRRDFDQLMLRLRGIHKGDYFQIILSFNPVLPASEWLRETFFVNRYPGARVLRSTYKHNPYLDAQYIQVLTDLQNQNHELDMVYRQGKFYRDDTSVVFRNLVIRAENEFPAFDDSYYGLDFGFTNPNALVELCERDAVLYCKQRLYQNHLTAQDLVEKFEKAGIAKHKIMYCDNANPGDIETLKRSGYRAFPQDKRQGSVLAGIRAVNNRTSVILRQGDSDLIREMTMYRWREINGVRQDEPAKVNDHCCDAVRSAYFTHNIRDIMRRIDQKNTASNARAGMRI